MAPSDRTEEPTVTDQPNDRWADLREWAALADDLFCSPNHPPTAAEVNGMRVHLRALLAAFNELEAERDALRAALVQQAEWESGRYLVLCDDGSVIGVEELDEGDNVLLDRLAALRVPQEENHGK